MEHPNSEIRDPKLPELRAELPGSRRESRVLPAPLPYNDVLPAP